MKASQATKGAWDSSQLTPRELNYALNVTSIGENRSEQDKMRFGDMRESGEFTHRHVSSGVYVANAFSDIKEGNVIKKMANGGCTLEKELKSLVEDIQKQDPKPIKLLIPITQHRKYFFGLIERAHFTTLEINFDEKGQVKDARHIDSKGWLSRLYSLSHIQDALDTVRSGLGDSMKREYLGQQGIMDNVNCGRFAMSYVNMIAENPNKSLQDYKIEEVKDNYKKAVDNPQTVERKVIKSAEAGAIHHSSTRYQDAVKEDRSAPLIEK